MYSHLRKTTLLFLFALLPIVLLPISGCGFRSSHPVRMRTSTATLREATLEQLVEYINANAEKLKTLKATVDIDSSFLQEKKNQVKDNPQVAGLILVRKPELLRMRIYVPLVHNVMADMVSNGKTFALAAPIKSKFFVGSNQQPVKPSPQPLENLRPQHISDALLLKPIEAEKELAVLESTTEIVKDPKSHKDVEQLAYTLVIIDKDASGYYLSRKIVFSRTDLLPHEQSIYDRQGRLVTFARYENFADTNGVSFPAIVSIQRPIEGYGITLSMVKLDVNVTLTDEQFVLTQPPGSQLINVDTKSSASAIHDEESKKPRQ
jgi:outer membrane lipoprotein-sorting protein